MLRAGASLACVVLLVACGGPAADAPAPRGAPGTPVAPSSPVPDPPQAPPPARPRVPDPDRFASDVRPLTAAERDAMTGVSWREGCPVGLEDLRRVEVTHRDWRQRRRTGVLVVRSDVADDVVAVFRALYRADFPVRRIRPVDAYGGDDYTSIEADNTSAFNCRAQTGSDVWSQHAYGIAVDLNPLENPYVYDGGRTSHDRSVPYLDRSARRGVITPDGPVVRAFAAVGWEWGGAWDDPIDYQHFSLHPIGTSDAVLAQPSRRRSEPDRGGPD